VTIGEREATRQRSYVVADDGKGRQQILKAGFDDSIVIDDEDRSATNVFSRKRDISGARQTNGKLVTSGGFEVPISKMVQVEGSRNFVGDSRLVRDDMFRMGHFQYTNI